MDYRAWRWEAFLPALVSCSPCDCGNPGASIPGLPGSKKQLSDKPNAVIHNSQHPLPEGGDYSLHYLFCSCTEMTQMEKQDWGQHTERLEKKQKSVMDLVICFRKAAKLPEGPWLCRTVLFAQLLYMFSGPSWISLGESRQLKVRPGLTVF